MNNAFGHSIWHNRAAIGPNARGAHLGSARRARMSASLQADRKAAVVALLADGPLLLSLTDLGRRIGCDKSTAGDIAAARVREGRLRVAPGRSQQAPRIYALPGQEDQI